MLNIKFLFNKVTIAFLALQILNLSIYNSDFFVYSFFASKSNPEQLANLNRIDCLAEMVLEDMAGCDDAFPETPPGHHKSAKQKGELKETINFKLFQVDNFARIAEKQIDTYAPYREKYALFRDNYSYLFIREISHPPA